MSTQAAAFQSLVHRWTAPAFALLMCGLLLLPAPSGATAGGADNPQALLEQVSKDMLAALRTDRAKIQEDRAHLNGLVETILVPHVDLITASRWVLGKYWSDATKEQKLDFIRQFRTLLVRFYSSALAEYVTTHEISDDIMTFQPLALEPGTTDVTVRSEVHPPSGSVVPVNYHMHLTPKGWKLYDVSVDGVSMVTTYRTDFATEIQSHGLDGLIQSLTERNRKLVEPRPAKTAS